MGKLLSILILSLLSSVVAASESVSLIEIFVDDANPIQRVKNGAGRDIEFVIYDLSAPERFEKELSRGVSGSLDQVKRKVLKKIQGLSTSYMEEHVMTPYKGLLKAMEYELIKLPAIVFNNGESVIYGVRSIKKAIQIRARSML